MSLLFLLLILAYPYNASATPPSFLPPLVCTLQKNITDDKHVIPMLKENAGTIFNGLASLRKELPVAVPSSKALQSLEAVSNLEFLFDQSSVSTITTDPHGNLDKVHLLEPGIYFRVLIPVIKKGTTYKKTRQGLMVRIDKFTSCSSVLADSKGKIIKRSSIIKEDAILASNLCLFVSKNGKVYGGFTLPGNMRE